MPLTARRETGTARDAPIVGLVNVQSRVGGNPAYRMPSGSVVTRFWLSRLWADLHNGQHGQS